jgi:hypothetical protein
MLRSYIVVLWTRAGRVEEIVAASSAVEAEEAARHWHPGVTSSIVAIALPPKSDTKGAA